MLRTGSDLTRTIDVVPTSSRGFLPSLPFLSGGCQRLFQCSRVPGHESHFVLLRDGHQAGRVRVSMHGMPIYRIVRLDAEAVEHAHEDQIKFTVGQQRAGTHAIAHAVSEQGGIWLFEPPLRTKDIRVGPHIWVYATKTRNKSVHSRVGRCAAIDLPILHAHAFRKNTVPLGITVPWYVTSRIDVRGKASRRTVKYLRLGQFLLGDWAVHIFH